MPPPVGVTRDPGMYRLYVMPPTQNGCNLLHVGEVITVMFSLLLHPAHMHVCAEEQQKQARAR